MSVKVIIQIYNLTREIVFSFILNVKNYQFYISHSQLLKDISSNGAIFSNHIHEH